jgi:hypothetical protein
MGIEARSSILPSEIWRGCDNAVRVKSMADNDAMVRAEFFRLDMGPDMRFSCCRKMPTADISDDEGGRAPK